MNNTLLTIDEMVSKGQILEVIDQHFDDHIKTYDHDGTITSNKAETRSKLAGFLGNIKSINEISHHRSLSNQDVTMSEFTFDFDMKDGSKVHWHEIIHRTWQNGKIIEERYFNQ